ncbi:MAG: NAD(P)/FAD-dependent oxidoreductase, partial [Candidatus Obscuribacterales bacterium]|nr:NAD(P)/FAD-dependent oxidoreductase [Steroidobacteraceae bacterium]
MNASDQLKAQKAQSVERPLRFVVIGAGLSGIMSAIKLEAAGYTDITIFEKAQRPGGTWRDNTYPGVACDIPSHLYSYSFAPNSEWSHRYAPGSEIQTYIESVVKRYGVERRIRFNEEITRCEFEEGRWHIETMNGHRDVADVIIAATGVTHHPNKPAIPGLDTFGDHAFHSARWNHNVALDQRRIGVIGTGSSAVQIVSALVKRASKLVLFQRTAQWIMPLENLPYSAAEQAQFRAAPESMRSLRANLARRFTETFSNALIDLESPQLKLIEQQCVANLETQVTNLKLRERLRPNYRVACKRLVVSPDFYQAIQQPNAQLITDDIEAIEPLGVRTRDGRLHELDVLVLATGFKTDRFMRPIEVIGRNGVSLDSVWSPRPRAYQTVTVPGVPNFFMLNGPSSPVGNFPLIEVAEVQMSYILQLVELLRTQRCREITPLE